MILNPKIIVTLGVTARDSIKLLNLQSKMNIVEMIHPAATIYKPERLTEFSDKFDYLKELINQMKGV